jgi:DNA invertase Pin-like site-specific DNA recombinase
VSTVIDDLGSLPARIRASADRLRDLKAETDNERKRRDELIVDAVDLGGMTTAAVARAAGVSQPQVIRILSAASSDDNDVPALGEN